MLLILSGARPQAAHRALNAAEPAFGELIFKGGPFSWPLARSHTTTNWSVPHALRSPPSGILILQATLLQWVNSLLLTPSHYHTGTLLSGHMMSVCSSYHPMTPQSLNSMTPPLLCRPPTTTDIPHSHYHATCHSCSLTVTLPPPSSHYHPTCPKGE